MFSANDLQNDKQFRIINVYIIHEDQKYFTSNLVIVKQQYTRNKHFEIYVLRYTCRHL